VEELIYRTNLSNSSPEGIVLAYDGDKAIGYCWTRIIYETATDERKGQIFMLGVDPDYRTFAMTQWTTRACSQLKVEDTIIL